MIVNAYFRALEDALVAAEESSFDIDLNNREQLSNLVRAVRPSTHRYSRGTHGVLVGVLPPARQLSNLVRAVRPPTHSVK